MGHSLCYAGFHSINYQAIPHMGTVKGPSEGGSGGKRGHSNMEHWGFTGEVKEAARKRRRLDSKRIVTEELEEIECEAPENT